MTFKDWILSNRPSDNVEIAGQWGWLHIGVLIACLASIIAIYFAFRNKSEKAKRAIVWVLVGIILFFELSRNQMVNQWCQQFRHRVQSSQTHHCLMQISSPY